MKNKIFARFVASGCALLQVSQAMAIETVRRPAERRQDPSNPRLVFVPPSRRELQPQSSNPETAKLLKKVYEQARIAQPTLDDFRALQLELHTGIRTVSSPNPVGYKPLRNNLYLRSRGVELARIAQADKTSDIVLAQRLRAPRVFRSVREYVRPAGSTGRVTPVYAGTFECGYTDKSSIDVAVNAADPTLYDVTIRCQRKRDGLEKSLVMTVALGEIDAQDRPSLHFLNCFQQFLALNNNNEAVFRSVPANAPASLVQYFRADFIYKTVACDAAPSKDFMNRFVRTSSFAKATLPTPNETLDKTLQIRWLNQSDANWNGEFNFNYSETYSEHVSQILESKNHKPTERVNQDLVVFSKEPLSKVPGLTFAVQTLNKPMEIPPGNSVEQYCTNWQAPAGLISTAYQSTKSRMWSKQELMFPSKRNQSPETYFPFPEQVSKNHINDSYQHSVGGNFFDGGVPDMDPVYFSGLVTQFPVANQPDYPVTPQWACGNAPNFGGNCSTAWPKQGSCSLGDVFKDNCHYCGCQNMSAELPLYVRIVPVVKSGYGYQCVGRPTRAMRMKLIPHLINDEATQALKQLAKELKQQEISDPYFKTASGNPNAYAPIKVEVLSYVADTSQFSQNPTRGVMKIVKEKSMPMIQAPFTDLFDEFAPQVDTSIDLIPDGKNECAYSPESLIYTIKHATQWDKIRNWNGIWDFLDDVLTGAEMYYGGIQEIFAEAIAYGYNEAGGDCGDSCKQVLVKGIQAGFAWIGIPASIPSASQLYTQGAAYLASVVAGAVVDAGTSAFPSLKDYPEGTDMAYEAARKFAENKLNAANPYNGRGRPECDENSGCVHVIDDRDPFMWGVLSGYGATAPSVLYIKVEANPGVKRFSDKAVVSIQSKTGIWQDQEVAIDLRTLPKDENGNPKPVILPVSLKPNVEKYYNDPNASCGSGCIDIALARAVWYQKAYLSGKATADLSVTTRYQWTDKSLLFVSPELKADWGGYFGNVEKSTNLGSLPPAPKMQAYGQVPPPDSCVGFTWQGDHVVFNGELKIQE